MSIKLILASGSPRRSEILSRQGFEFEIIKSTCEENTDKTKPDEVVIDLSRQKAQDVYGMLPEDGEYLILAADTVVAADGSVLGKPMDEQDAAAMLMRIQGNRHQVYTGVTMLYKGNESHKTISFAECTHVDVYPMDDAEIKAYIATGEPMDKAGAYGIQGIFSEYIKGIEGNYDNVVGLPIARICHECTLISEIRKKGE